jgi:hypothetical protein
MRVLDVRRLFIEKCPRAWKFYDSGVFVNGVCTEFLK